MLPGQRVEITHPAFGEGTLATVVGVVPVMESLRVAGKPDITIAVRIDGDPPTLHFWPEHTKGIPCSPQN